LTREEITKKGLFDRIVDDFYTNISIGFNGLKFSFKQFGLDGGVDDRDNKIAFITNDTTFDEIGW